jgi:hypothetical protein
MKKSFRWWMLVLLALLAVGIGVIWWSIANGHLLSQGLRNPLTPITVTRGHCYV